MRARAEITANHFQILLPAFSSFSLGVYLIVVLLNRKNTGISCFCRVLGIAALLLCMNVPIWLPLNIHQQVPWKKGITFNADGFKTLQLCNGYDYLTEIVMVELKF